MHAASFSVWKVKPVEVPETFDAVSSAWRVWGFRLALKITGCPDAAEDALQEALFRALRSRGSLRNPESGTAWFRRILVRCALGQVPARPVQPSEEPVAASAEADIVEALHVRRTLSKLRPAHRAVLALAIGEGLSYAEIADAMGVREGTIASRLHAAKKAFRTLWEDEQ